MTRDEEETLLNTSVTIISDRDEIITRLQKVYPCTPVMTEWLFKRIAETAGNTGTIAQFQEILEAHFVREACRFPNPLPELVMLQYFRNEMLNAITTDESLKIPIPMPFFERLRNRLSRT